MSGFDITAAIVSAAERSMERHAGRAFHVPTATYATAQAEGYDDARKQQRVYSRDAETFVRTALTEYGCDWEIRVEPEHWDLQGGGAVACTDGANYIGIAGNDTCALTLLHEAAHVLACHAGGERGHGDVFLRVAHELYRDFLGVDAARIFADVVDINTLTC